MRFYIDTCLAGEIDSSRKGGKLLSHSCVLSHRQQRVRELSPRSRTHERTGNGLRAAREHALPFNTPTKKKKKKKKKKNQKEQRRGKVLHPEQESQSVEQHHRSKI